MINGKTLSHIEWKGRRLCGLICGDALSQGRGANGKMIKSKENGIRESSSDTYWDSLCLPQHYCPQERHEVIFSLPGYN